MTNPIPEFRIYVACLASYNAGTLHGAWIDLEGGEKDEDEVQAEIAAMLRASPYPNVEVDCPHPDGIYFLAGSPMCMVCRDKGKVPSAEEWAIHDYDGFGGLGLGEHEDIATILMHAKMLDFHGDAWRAYVAWGKGDPTEDDFDECYRGHFSSRADFAEEFAEDTCSLGDVPDFIKYHIDWDGIARDMQMGGDVYFTSDDGPTHVFDNY